MARFEVRVQLSDVEAHNAYEARKIVEERLKACGQEPWRIMALRPQGTKQRGARKGRQLPGADQFVAGSILLGALLAWWVWFWMTSANLTEIG